MIMAVENWYTIIELLDNDRNAYSIQKNIKPFISFQSHAVYIYSRCILCIYVGQTNLIALCRSNT